MIDKKEKTTLKKIDNLENCVVVTKNNILDMEDMKKLFEKLELFPTLNSISIILPYTNDKSIIEVFKLVTKNKYEKFKDEFEGINEYDYITQILNFDISEFGKNIDLFSIKELIFVQFIINNAIKGIDKENFVAKIIPILEENKEIGANRLAKVCKTENITEKHKQLYLYKK